MKKTSDAVEILNRTFGNSPERRRAIQKEREKLEDLHQFTEQEIEEHCQKLNEKCIAGNTYKGVVFDSLQIIRQLQSKVDKKVSLDLGADKYYD